MIIDRIVDDTRKRVSIEKQSKERNQIIRTAEERATERNFCFENALKKPLTSFICEIKRASPSRGVIAQNFNHKQLAREYEQAGADALSVLTEPNFFLGCNNYLTDIKEITNMPVLRKDFIIDEYQIFEASAIGSDAILLIASILTGKEIKQFLQRARELRLSVLAETRSEREIGVCVDSGANIIGVNNRDLRTFEVDLNTTATLRHYVPSSVLFVSESGIKNRESVEFLESIGVDAILIGEHLVRSDDKLKYLNSLRGI
ncbi:MAG: indole-3-glycerol phosphate synthase TrpC [Christensenellaceae bacterium]|jgi:indole-3-glycerol phosphate synthase|nr:indole-3-glycerol phosphate synthase TrpC [Christensenellaceae bacterium]